MSEAYPLQWPAGLPRTKYPKRSQFATPQYRAQQSINWELKRLGARNVVISTNIELKANGQPYARQLRADEDSGVAVYFTLNDRQQCIAIDKWLSVAENMQAIAKTIEAMRGLERWGGKDIVDAAFSGFKALPQSASANAGPRAWYDVLGVSPDAPREVVRAAYRALALKAHPDQGGSSENWQELQNAYQQSGAGQ